MTGLVGGSGTFESNRDLAFVGSDAESGQPVSCDTTSPSDAPHAILPTSLFVYNQSALVTCDTNCSTDTTNWQANSDSVFCESSGMLTDLDAHKPVQYPVPEVPPASSLGGTTLGESCTGLGRDADTQSLECVATGHFASWKKCKRGASFHQESSPVHSTATRTVRCISVGYRTRAASATLWTDHLSCDMKGRHANLHYYTAVVCQKPKQGLRNAAMLSEQVSVAKHGELVAHEYTEGCRDIDWCPVTFTCAPGLTGLTITPSAAHLGTTP